MPSPLHQIIKDNIRNEAVSNMLIQRMNQKLPNAKPPLNTSTNKGAANNRPKSSGLKFLSKVAS